MSGEFFTSHATYVTPVAARRLLATTREACNRKKADYAIRLACLGPAVDRCLRTRGTKPCDFRALAGARVESTRDPGRQARSTGTAEERTSSTSSLRPLRCLRPPRLLWQRGIESVGVWGQDHLGITSYSQLEVVHAIPGMNHTFHPRALHRADSEVRAELTRLRAHQCRRQMCKAGVRDACPGVL